MTETAPPAGYYVPPPPPPYAVGAAIKWAWYMFRKHWKVFVTGMILPLAVILAFYVRFLALYIPLFDDFSGGSITDEQALDFFKQVAVMYGVLLVASIPLSVLYANMIRAALVTADGGTPTFRMLVSTKRAGRIVLANVMIGFGIFLGTLLCYFPGLAFAAFSVFTLLFIVDHDLPALAAIKASFRLVRANFGLVALTILAMVGINYAGSMALMIGMAVSSPLCLLIQAYAYRSLVPATHKA